MQQRRLRPRLQTTPAETVCCSRAVSPPSRNAVTLSTIGGNRPSFEYIALAALTELAAEGAVPASTAADAIARYDIDPDKTAPALA